VLRRRGVQRGAAVGQQVVVAGQGLVARPRQVACRGQHGRAVLEHGPGQRVAVGPGDQRAADPGHAALVLAAVGHRDEDPVGGRGGLRLDHLGGPLPRRVGRGGPVHRGGDEVGASQRGQPDPFGELQVVADHHADPAEPQVHHGGRRVARGEDQLLLVPQMGLAVDRPGPGRIHDRRAVKQAAADAALAEAADDRQPVLGGQGAPLAQGDAVVRGRGEGTGLGGRPAGIVAEHVAGIAQLGQHHEPRARHGRLGHREGGGLAVGVRLADGDGQLGDGDDGLVHRVRSVRRGADWACEAM